MASWKVGTLVLPALIELSPAVCVAAVGASTAAAQGGAAELAKQACRGNEPSPRGNWAPLKTLLLRITLEKALRLNPRPNRQRNDCISVRQPLAFIPRPYLQ